MSRFSELTMALRGVRDKDTRWRLALERARRNAKNDNDVKELKVSLVKHPLWLRAGGADYFTFLQIFLSREYEHGLSIAPKLIIDAGANIGLASVFFANQYPEADILSIEPDEANFVLLQRNTAAYPNIRCLRGAVWPTTATLTIANADSCGNPAAYQVRESVAGDTGALPCFTPATLLALSGKESIDIFKIDIEGAEFELFSREPQSWLYRVRLILAEIHDTERPGCGEAFFRTVCGRRFQFWQRSETTIIRFLDNPSPPG